MNCPSKLYIAVLGVTLASLALLLFCLINLSDHYTEYQAVYLLTSCQAPQVAEAPHTSAGAGARVMTLERARRHSTQGLQPAPSTTRPEGAPPTSASPTTPTPVHLRCCRGSNWERGVMCTGLSTRQSTVPGPPWGSCFRETCPVPAAMPPSGVQRS